MRKSNSSAAELKWTNQNFTDSRLHQWLIEHQTAVFETIQQPTLQSIVKVVGTAFIIYKYYFRLLIRDEALMEKYDSIFDLLLNEVRNAKKDKDKVHFNFDVFKTAVEMISELSRIVQEGKYFFNIAIDSKRFSDALEQLKELLGEKDEDLDKKDSG